MRGPAPNGIATRLAELAAVPAEPSVSQRSGRKRSASAKCVSLTAAGRIRHITRLFAGTSMPCQLSASYPGTAVEIGGTPGSIALGFALVTPSTRILPVPTWPSAVATAINP